MTDKAVTLKKKILLLLWPLALICIVYGLIIYALISNEKVWFTAIPIVLLIVSIRNILVFYLNIEPEMIEANKNAGKGTWKVIAIMTFVLALSFSTQAYFGFSQRYLDLVMQPVLIVSVVIYILLRQRRFHREAKEKIEKRKLREQKSRAGE